MTGKREGRRRRSCQSGEQSGNRWGTAWAELLSKCIQGSPVGADWGWAPRVTGLFCSAQFPCYSPFPKYWVRSWMRDVALGLEGKTERWRLQNRERSLYLGGSWQMWRTQVTSDKGSKECGRLRY
ncbi:hypothetical protein mRhiFer1_009050 [Rhinolophus ferrumequinum]|uniref:Uncharacterized protein n=1 Tax=Rhinolophus ferrumequinum TaxID=59479 RepID=A0A7J7SXI1_RHIFE|nr:hypothetical protein mRhiFer1_009050 [Rhinolophus ferrumequinum]